MGLLRSSHADKSVPIHEKEDAGPVSQTAEQIREICLKGTKQAQEGAPNDAVETFESALPMIAEITTAQLAASNDLKQWSELLLTRFCAVASQMIQNTDSTWLEAETLSAFRAWEAYWAKQSTQHVGGSGFEAEAPRRQVWKQYFATLSFILQNDLQYPSTALATTYKDHSTRQIQSAELVRIEQRYEALLLAEVQFPKAEQHSEEVEEWVSIVTKNWKVLCGGSWEEHDLGAKGRVGVSRHVLDILYRAATKTYHSTQILRQLFTVHLAVAELDLAFKAFETYLEIMKKAKEQVAKTGEQQAGLDSDGDLLRTASECIIALCKYGELEAAEKAKELAVYLEPWLKGCDSLATTSNGHTRNVSIESKGTSIDPRSISPSVCSQGWRAIAIAYAQWARLTYESNLRSDYQLKAIGCLQKALRPEYGHSDDVDALFALATLLAERRQIGVAIKMVGAALSSKQATRAESISGNYARERSLIPLWHLLALLLSAKHEFAEASRACEGAFTQFGDMRTLIGDIDSTYQSEHLKQLHGTPGPKAVIDIMSDFEKEAVLDIKMTQLILAEVQDGPEEAINGTEELLSLYSRLFGEPQGPPETAATQTQPPRTGTSTIRSIKGSIFGRSRRSRRVSNATTAASTKGNGALHEHPENIQTPAAAAPTIQVTGENGNPHDASKFGHHQSNSPRSEKVLHKRSQKSINKRYVSTPIPESGNLASSQGDSASSGRPLSQLVDDLHDEKPDPHLTRFPLASLGPPAICFSVDQSRRHRTGILIRVWLLIAGFYRRAEQWDDAKMAIDAACELVEGLEVDVSRDKTGKVTIHDRGWGVGKSVEEQWADVWSEVSIVFSI